GKIHFADRQNGWASTFPVIWSPNTFGLIYATRDGGETWRVQHKGPIINDLCFIDSNRGWAVGFDLSIRRGVILATKNGGRTWERQWEIRGSFLRVLFLNPKFGWTVGIQGIILQTQDGGKTWQVQESGVNVYLWGLAYNGKDAVVATGDWSTIVRYTDATLAALAISPKEKQITTWAHQKNAVFQNFPNPFNPETWFPFALNRRSNVEIQIYSANGNLVRTLRLGGKAPGIYRSKPQAAYWDGKTDTGEAMSSGLYFYSLITEGAVYTKRMVITK
ncbi:T9SS type A sorting domain-containing protein, partial [Candidatus Poribacteria bacterium]|nr:T9SS type A sorting domain-containing protein [Candidatus Poribacteria bacterium]